MKSIMAARSPHDSSSSTLSFSRRYFNCGKSNITQENNNGEDILTSTFDPPLHVSCTTFPKPRLLHLSKLTSLFTNSSSSSSPALSPTLSPPPALGSKVVGTLFGHRRGHVHVAFQDGPTSAPAFLIELSTSTSVLVREMASGLVKVALECDKVPNWDDSKGSKKKKKKGKKLQLLNEPLWRAYCNGKKCGYAMRRECGPQEWRVLRSVGPISMGAGVLPAGLGLGQGQGPDSTPRIGSEEEGEEGEIMYMRAKFERVVGSKDCEAFYMMNPDGSGGPELSVYLLRV